MVPYDISKPMQLKYSFPRNGDGRISFSEFRVMMGGFPMVTSQPKKIPSIKQT